MNVAQLDTQTLVARLFAMIEQTGGPVALIEDENGEVQVGVIDADPAEVDWLEGWTPLPVEDVAAST